MVIIWFFGTKNDIAENSYVDQEIWRSSVKVGDLVRYWKDGTTGLVMDFDGQFYTVLFGEVKLSYVSHDELELISESR